VNRLKRTYDSKLWKPKPQQNRAKRAHKTETKSAEKEAEFRNGSFALVIPNYNNRNERATPPNETSNVPDPAEPIIDTPFVIARIEAPAETFRSR